MHSLDQWESFVIKNWSWELHDNKPIYRLNGWERTLYIGESINRRWSTSVWLDLARKKIGRRFMEINCWIVNIKAFPLWGTFPFQKLLARVPMTKVSKSCSLPQNKTQKQKSQNPKNEENRKREWACSWDRASLLRNSWQQQHYSLSFGVFQIFYTHGIVYHNLLIGMPFVER